MLLRDSSDLRLEYRLCDNEVREMLKITGSEDYYPTPDSFLKEITDGMDWENIYYVLEPSAGKGNIVEHVITCKKNWGIHHCWGKRNVDIDCIEIEPELRAILKGKEFRVVHDDFLTFHTYKHYDLIFMNPPFSVGARHLLKAIEVQSVTGGGIICILNAETIRNAYTRERQELVHRLERYRAEIKYYENAFSVAENPTKVECAVVKLIVPVPERQTTIFDTLREKEYEEYECKRETSELAESDIVRAFVAQYNRELEWGLRLYDELLELNSKALDGKGLLQLYVGEYSREGFSVNGYVRRMRYKYWQKFFAEPIFYRCLTSNLAREYTSQVNRFAEFDFSLWNIKTVQEEIARTLIKGVEDCIINLFDELSHKHSWSEELELGNVHYFNGWKSNSSWKINQRIVMPWMGFYQSWSQDSLHFDPFHGGAYGNLSDLEKVLNYLDNGETEEIDLSARLKEMQSRYITRNIQLKYFTVTFYKKGTCHITFTNERLLKKLNIFGSQSKGWLPYGYARRCYEEFEAEEQAVIESFEGRESYNETVMNSQYYLFDAGQSIPMLEAGK